MTNDQENFILKSFSLKNKSWFYKAEGNCNIVLAIPEKHEVIRIRKYQTDNINLEPKQITRFQHDFYYYKYVYPVLLHPNLICLPIFINIPLSEINYINEKIDHLRPDYRRKKKLYSGLALLYPDFTQLLDPFTMYSNSSVVTIEIKPKQGHYVEEDRLHMCKYCLKQFQKLESNRIKKISQYCPLDLYSGNIHRMFKAMVSLFNNPQNNLKIFDNGKLIFSERQEDNNELDSVLTRLFGSFNINESKNILINLIINSLLQDISDLKNTFSLNLNQIISNESIKENEEKVCNWKRETLKEYSVLNLLICNEENEDLPPLPEFFPNPDNLNFEDFEKLPKDLRYLLFSTAADCSIMLSYKQIRCNQDRLFHEHKKDFQVIQIKDIPYMFRAKIIDLDIKTKSRIVSHYKTKALWKKQYSNMT